ncbi:hypothetical protein Bca101_027420 [Brassica carinata]
MANSSILLAEGWPEMGSSSVLESRIGGFKSVKALETGVSKELQRLERHLQWPNSFDVSERFYSLLFSLRLLFFSYYVSLKSITLDKYAHGLQNVFDFGLNGGLLSRSCFGFMFVAMHAVKKRLRGSLTIYT